MFTKQSLTTESMSTSGMNYPHIPSWDHHFDYLRHVVQSQSFAWLEVPFLWTLAVDHLCISPLILTRFYVTCLIGLHLQPVHMECVFAPVPLFLTLYNTLECTIMVNIQDDKGGSKFPSALDLLAFVIWTNVCQQFINMFYQIEF